MEIIQNQGVSVFIENGTLPESTEWSNTVSAGYWIGILLSGKLLIDYAPLGSDMWESGNGVFLSSDKDVESKHYCQKRDAVSAVFLHFHPGAADQILGAETLDRFGNLKLPQVGSLGTLAWQMMNCRLEGVSRKLFLSGKGLELAGHMIEAHAPARSKTQGFGAREIEILNEARSILMRELSDPPSVADLALRLGINATKLSNGFRELFGVPPYAFSKAYRLERAMHLFDAGETSVGSVAAQLGYQPRHLSTEFRRRFGVCPRDYLKSR